MFSCRIYELFKNILFDVCERLLLKPVLKPGLPFLINYTSGSNWYICFCFCIIIHGFVCQSSLHYYWLLTVTGGVLQIRASYHFRKFHKKTPTLKTRFQWSCRSTEFNFIKQEIPAQMFFFFWILRNFS